METSTVNAHLLAAQGAPPVEVSVVMPCLNEADTVGTCVCKAAAALEDHGILGEVIIADNGSQDRSAEIAARLGARIVDVPLKGYGSALRAGIEAARGRFIVMADADDSYNMLDLQPYVEKLREGYDLVQGCRLPAGGGLVLRGAMPFLHRWWGNPMLSLLARKWFGAPVTDVYCGMRGFTRDLFDRLDLRCTGMEFATEMIIKATLSGARITEIPTTLYPDGRKTRRPHLRTFQDGWRTLRLFLIYSPRWLFQAPGLFATALGLFGYAIALPGVRLGRATFDAHTLLFASLFLLLGQQSILFALFTKVFAMRQGFLPTDTRTERFLRLANLERGLVVGLVLLTCGLLLLGAAVNQWREASFGPLDYGHTMRWVIPGATLTALGFQTILASFFLAVLGMARRS
jgi:glycosyltransferase involved in cell wall biosynthesis